MVTKFHYIWLHHQGQYFHLLVKEMDGEFWFWDEVFEL